MGFKPAPHIQGRIFIPEEEPPARKKHSCPDCFKCQLCGEERCRVCRSERDHQAAGRERPCGKIEKEAH